jgi:hypothetical protein
MSENLSKFVKQIRASHLKNDDFRKTKREKNENYVSLKKIKSTRPILVEKYFYYSKLLALTG